VREAGADVESKSNSRRTPLSLAAENGHLEIVKVLVEEGGTDVESKDKSQRTPLSLAAENGRLEVVKFLVEKGGADVESKDNNGEMALDLARRGIWKGWVFGDPEGRKARAVAAWLEEREKQAGGA